MTKNSGFFSKKLIIWYLEHKRDLPWRETKAPYFIWLSEIMLQQTRVNQGLPYYLKFIKAFPTIKALADASEDQVLKLWQGLGYYSRARNLHSTAKYIAYECDGLFPQNYDDLLALKGVGDYTASAIASICFDAPTAVVDGNVYRVLSRVFGIDTPINTTQGIKEFKTLAQQLLDYNDPGTYNQAIMEFGAGYCVPQNPHCDQCIFASNCEAYSAKKVSQLPVKLKKSRVKKRYFNYIVLLSENERTQLEQRNQKGIWQQLYEFPLIETTAEATAEALMATKRYKELSKKYNIESLSLYNEEVVVHKLSHQHLYTRFWIAEVSEEIELNTAISKVTDYAVPVLIANFISEFSVFKN